MEKHELSWSYCLSTPEAFKELESKGYKYRGRVKGNLLKIFHGNEFGSVSEDMLTGTEMPFFVKDGEIITGVLE